MPFMRRGDFGDLYVQIKTEVPVYLNKEQKDLLERFRKIENEKSNPSIKKFFQKLKASGMVDNGIRANNSVFLIAVLILVLPAFLSSNSNSKQFFKNLFIWSVIVISIVVVFNLIFK